MKKSIIAFRALLILFGLLSSLWIGSLILAFWEQEEKKSNWLQKEAFEYAIFRIGARTFEDIGIPLQFDRARELNPSCCGAESDFGIFGLLFGNRWKVILVLQARCKEGIIKRGIIVEAVAADNGRMLKFRYEVNTCPGVTWPPPKQTGGEGLHR